AAAAERLVLWHAYRGGEEQAIGRAVERFTSETGLEVDLLAVPYDALSSKLTSSIPHGVGPDVFIFAHERLQQFHRLGVVAPVTALEAAKYLPQSVAALEISGTRYGYPLSLKCLGLYVNTALVAEAPKTTAELERALSATSDAASNRFGLAYEAGDFYFHAPILFGFGGELFDPNGRAQFDTPAMARSLTYVKSLLDRRFVPQEASGALVKSLFNEGRAAFVISGPWFAGEIDPSIHWSLAPLPRISENNDTPMTPFLGVEAAYVSSQSKHTSDAHRLAEFLSLGEAASIRAQLGQQIVATVTSDTGDALQTAFRAVAEHAVPTPNTLEMGRVWEPMRLALRAVLQGGVSPEQAGALAERRYRALNRERPPDADPRPWIAVATVVAFIAAGWAWRKRLTGTAFARAYPDARKAIAWVSPAAVGVAVLIFMPFVVGLSLSLFHHEAGSYSFVGLANFTDILASRGYRMTEPLSFYFTLVVTLLWTAANVVLHVSIGLALALLLKNPLLKLRGVYRVVLIIPWAIPNYITALMWKGLFHRQFGAINAVLAIVGVEPVSWFTRWSTAFAANVATNTWLGFPFMMVVSLGALQSIPADLYEAAEVDGASKWAQFRHITLPLLRPALLPAIILGSVWTFNMFNIIYLVSGGEPGGGTDILVSEAYRWAFQRNEQYGFAAAYSVLIFFVLFAWSSLTKRLTEEQAT
ncbi:MAG: extracellular solute-binding protein, partial [Archangium sp.]|nr:extracellular solute-binding protein [Archangium sp.]